MVKVEFYAGNYEGAGEFTYVVVGARHRGEWVFVKSRKRASFELPAGHIDGDETPADAAGRELMEETGATSFVIECINLYSVDTGATLLWGKLYLAEILECGEIIDIEEIEAVSKGNYLQGDSVHSEIQGILLGKLKEVLARVQLID